jgi:hypothetical protein
VRISNLGGIAQHFHCEVELMRQMLRHWVRKGCVRQFAKTPGCQDKCGHCSVAEYEIYEWVLYHGK